MGTLTLCRDGNRRKSNKKGTMTCTKHKIYKASKSNKLHNAHKNNVTVTSCKNKNLTIIETHKKVTLPRKYTINNYLFNVHV